MGRYDLLAQSTYMFVFWLRTICFRHLYYIYTVNCIDLFLVYSWILYTGPSAVLLLAQCTTFIQQGQSL